ncbi:MAG TPA: hypothetical protein VNZ43_16235 [Sphingomonadaceae bacterium]|nr:hypothetical protein [Sphingomonadaceae bacterium]
MSVTSDFYLARAADSARDARNTDLVNVRERCLRAEAAWRSMAQRLLLSEKQRERQALEKANRLADEG